jgi:ATP-dependent protease ClpP protease subunit
MADNDKPKLPFFLNESDLAKWTGYWHSHRRILVDGELNAESLKKTSLELIKLDYTNSEPITLMIKSGGGKVVPTHQLEDMFSIINSPVDALVMGDCASMAIDLVQMCRNRKILPSGRVLVHYIRNDQPWIVDDLDQLEIDIELFRKRQREVADRRLALYEKRTGLSRERILELFRHGEVHSSYLSAQQAIESHLVDEIETNFKLFPKKTTEQKQ